MNVRMHSYEHTHFTVRPEPTVEGSSLPCLWRDLPMAEINAFLLVNPSGNFQIPV